MKLELREKEKTLIVNDILGLAIHIPRTFGNEKLAKRFAPLAGITLLICNHCKEIIGTI
ncbi:unnamed protein product [marine sediment metagenome]|uniref:Uncharacterized protein n=1 Tax=marine sediment metagenome TaxID=412755 RepID=X1ABE6_9ZZZZ